MKEKIIFLDRDGVINQNPRSEYVTSIEEFEFIQSSVVAMRDLSQAGYKIFIISNQQGVGKGIFSRQILDDITNWMLKSLKKEGVKVSGVYYCTHLENSQCPCRKPRAGLIEKATKGLEVDFKEVFFIGDTERDIKTAETAGCKAVLVLSGKTKNADIVNTWQDKPDYIFNDLNEAAKFILNKT
jgi:D-glycero-D-manno-heptose 1,7-bisphosphate phosphatase